MVSLSSYNIYPDASLPHCIITLHIALRHPKSNTLPPHHKHISPPLSATVISRHHVSYFALFPTPLKSPTFAPACKLSDGGGFSVQANRASCVFVRQKCFCPTKTVPTRHASGRHQLQSRERAGTEWKTKQCNE